MFAKVHTAREIIESPARIYIADVCAIQQRNPRPKMLRIHGPKKE